MPRTSDRSPVILATAAISIVDFVETVNATIEAVGADHAAELIAPQPTSVPTPSG